MDVNLKIYKFSDPDMYALHNARISVPALIKLAVAYRARGKRLRIFVPDCLYCDLSGQKRHIPLKVTVTDKASIDHLRTALKDRQRTAYIKTVLRDCLVEQITGPTLGDRQLVQAENARLRMETDDYKKYKDILIIIPGEVKRKRSYYQMILNRTLEIPCEKAWQKKKPATPWGRTATGTAAPPRDDIPAVTETSEAEKSSGFVPASYDGEAADEIPKTGVNDAAAGYGTDGVMTDGYDISQEMTEEEADEDFFSQFEGLE